MAQVTARSQENNVAEIGKDLPRAAHEIAEPRMRRPNEAPDDTQRNQPGNRVAYGDVEAIRLVAGNVGGDEERNQRPMKQAHERVPNFHRRRLPHAAGFDGISHVCHQAITSCR